MKSRKLWLFIISIIILTIALFLQKVTGTEWVSGQVSLFGLYVAGNVGEHKYENVSKRKK